MNQKGLYITFFFSKVKWDEIWKEKNSDTCCFSEISYMPVVEREEFGSTTRAVPEL